MTYSNSSREGGDWLQCKMLFCNGESPLYRQDFMAFKLAPEKFELKNIDIQSCCSNVLPLKIDSLIPSCVLLSLSSCYRFEKNGFKCSLVPFVSKYQPSRLKMWLENRDEQFPNTVEEGATPRIPLAPKLEELVLLNMEEVTKEVKERIRKLDKYGDLEKAIKAKALQER